MAIAVGNRGSNSIGHAWLRRDLSLAVPPPAVESYVAAGARRTELRGRRIVEQYPRQYATEDSIVAHLRFALRHEPIDLGVLVATFKAIEAADLEAWVRAEPTGAFSRRAWFFYETFTGRMLDLDDARTGNYVPALDPDKHIVGEPRRSRRHRVADNLLGGPGLCPTVRRTPRLTDQMDLRIDRQAWALIESIDAGILARAVHYLFTKETRSSFALEGETPSTARSERFVAALREGGDFDPSDKAALIRLQGDIVDPRYAATGWRTFQNFVGATVGGYREDVHFVGPRPGDVPGLHHVLARRGYSPPGVIFPVSAAILRDRRSYDETLETFSRATLGLIRWRWTAAREIVVDNETADLYRYFDATAFAEYLHDRVADTVRRDLTEELAFIAVFDRACAAVREIVDMPDRRVALFVRLCMQNGGRLSAKKRRLFAELEDVEVDAMQASIGDALADATSGP